MKEYFLSGVVLPQRATITIEPPPITANIQDIPHPLRIETSIYLNQITIKISDVPEDYDIFTLRNVVRELVSDLINCVGYIKGYSYDIEITKIHDGGGFVWVYGIDIPIIEQRSSHLSPDDFQSRVNDLYQLCMGDDGFFFRRCLNDCVMAIRHPIDTGFYCYRALESLKQHFGKLFNIDGDKRQWEKMAEILGGDKNALNIIRDYAFPARHGVPKPIQESARIEIFNKTWDVIDKYIQYRYAKGTDA